MKRFIPFILLLALAFASDGQVVLQNAVLQNAVLGAAPSSPPPSDTAFITTVNSLDGNFNVALELGMRIVVGASPITITQLGRYVHSGDTGENLPMNLYDSGCSVLATVSVSTSGGTTGTFVYSAITPIVLSAGGTYYLTCTFDGGGDQWSNNGTTITTTGVAGTLASLSSCANSSGQTFGPVTFKYHL